jgi:hypothetical protein
MYCESGIDKYGCVNEDMVSLFFEVDNEIVDSYDSDCIENIFIESHDMFYRNCEKFMFDSRFDSLEIDMKYKMGM